MKSRRSISALGAFFVVIALLVAGCGSSGGVPSGSVASVAGNPISLRALNHWMYLVVKQQSSESPNSPIIVPNDPPEFTTCIKEAKAGYPQLKKESDAEVRKTCQGVFSQLSNEVLQFFITGYWYQAYAHKLGITITNAQIQKQIDKEKKEQGIKTQAAFVKFLHSVGYTLADIDWRTRETLVLQKLEAKYNTKVTSADIAAYYKAHSSTFGTPETRNMRIVLAKTQATAQKALTALKSGQSWKVVAKKYSTDPTTKNNGGLLENVSQGQQDAALSKAAFAAAKGKLVGPVKGSFGYYVVQVIKITPATHQSLAKATPQIKETLTNQKQTNASTQVNKKAKALYGNRTVCAKYYVISLCKGYKKPKTTSTSAATAPSTTPATSSTSASGSATATTSSTSSK
ncbi:MAG TPA: peptidyl-prolyl cis-trans isomerase [Solirubrobacteraceae bacterium]|nr:peptidyl-prolyl cis-trans isomerase [Solirubrobacteraceae bacterium]